jgi:hypothetical protein
MLCQVLQFAEDEAQRQSLLNIDLSEIERPREGITVIVDESFDRYVHLYILLFFLGTIHAPLLDESFKASPNHFYAEGIECVPNNSDGRHSASTSNGEFKVDLPYVICMIDKNHFYV